MAIDKAKILKLADKHIAKQNYNKALNELLKVLKVSPGDVNLLNKIGDLYNKLGKEENAISYFLKVAESYQHSGFNLKAIALYKKIIRINDKYMDARHRLVDLYIQQGYHSETKGELRRMAEYYYGENLFARALDCYEKMVEIDPNNLDARIKITELLVREGKRDEATEHFVAMGRELLDKTMVNEAKKIIGQGLKMSPAHPGLLILLSRTYLAEGNTEEALAQLTEIYQGEPNNLEALNLLGQTYLSRNQVDDAKQLYLRAFALSQEDPGPLEDISRLLLNEGRLDDAFDALKPIGEMFMERGEHEEATRLFRSVLYADEDHIPSQEMLVRIYRESQQTSNALLALEKVIHHYLDRSDATLALARIEEILELDPNNQEWRSKHNELAGASEVSDLEGDEIHVFDENPHEQILGDGTLDVDMSAQGMTDDSADQETKLANHITEANVFIKYGILDQALEHLEAAKDLDFLHEEVNTRLKGIYLQKGDVNKAIPCMVSLVNASLDQKDFAGAQERVAEIETYNKDVAAIHRSRIETIAGDAGVAPAASADGFDLDFGDAAAIAEPSSDLLFDAAPGDQEVMDFRKMPPPQAAPFEMEAPGEGDEPWSLDMPTDEHSLGGPAGGAAEDFRDLYDPSKVGSNQTGAFDLPGLADLADDSRLDISMPDDMGPLTGPPTIDTSGLEASDMLDLDVSMDELELESEPEPEPKLESEPPPPPPSPVAPEPRKPRPTAAVPPPPPPPEGSSKPPASSKVMHAPLGGAAQGGSLANELEEIDFFISVEAFEDARNLIDDARQQFGEHPLLMERQHEVDAKTQGVRPAGPVASNPAEENSLLGELDEGGGFFDLAAELNEELFEEEGSGEVNDATSKEEIQSVEELFQEFKKGVDEQIDEGDHETHYDLGIAYKEMGLLDEAISEFEKARNDKNRFLECAIMIGNCLIELGRTEDAVSHYVTHLAVPGLALEMTIPLRYELALAFQSAGELEKALVQLREIQVGDADYRDVSNLINALL